MKFSQTLASLLTASLLVACGGDNNNSKKKDAPEKKIVDDKAGEFDHLDPNNPLYLVKINGDLGNGLFAGHYITDTLDSTTALTPQNIDLVVPGYTGIAIPEGNNPDHAFFVGHPIQASFQRYVIDENGKPKADRVIDFTATGVQNTGRALMRAGKIISASQGYFLDHKSLQIVEFNPTEMTITDKVSLKSLEEKSLPGRWSIFPVMDGDRFIATISYSDADSKPAAHTKVVILDTKTNKFVTDTSTQCGSVSASAKDAAGNMYFASHDDTALSHFKGASAFPPCAIRINSGANEWDDSYLLNLQNLTNDGRLAMTVMPGKGNIGYTQVLSSATQATLDPDTALPALRGTVWEFHRVDLTDDAATSTKLDYQHNNMSRVQYGAFKHHQLGDITWMFRMNGNGISSTIINSTDPESWTDLAVAPGMLEMVGRLR